MRRIIIFSTAVAAMIALLAVSVGKSSKISSAMAVSVEEGPASIEISCNGQIEAVQHAEIYLAAPAVADEVLVQVGDRVTAGETLFTLDLAASRLLLTAASATPEELSTLLFAGAFSASGDANANGVLSSSYASAISGTVTAVRIQPHSLYQSAEAAVTVEDLSELTARLFVPQDAIASVRSGDRVILEGAGLNGEISGVVQDVAPSAQQISTGGVTQTVVPVTVSLTSDTKGAKPNFTVTARIFSASESRGLWLPYQAIHQDEENQEYVFLLSDGGAAEKRVVTTGEETVRETEILSGLKRGEVVLIGEDLREGERIQLEGWYE